MNIPEGYEVLGAAEGMRSLVEKTPVYAQTAAGPGTGKLEYENRVIARFGPKSLRKTVETLAWLDYDSRNGLSDEERRQCLAGMASVFRDLG